MVSDIKLETDRSSFLRMSEELSQKKSKSLIKGRDTAKKYDTLLNSL